MAELKGEIPKQIIEDLKSGKLNNSIGTYPKTCDTVSIDTPAVKGQRPVKAKRIADNLRDVGGFDWRLFGTPLVARNKENGELFVYDGNHRVAKLRVAQPGMKIFPCTIIDFENEVDINNAFWRINGGNSARVTAEEQWVHQWLGQMATARQLANSLLIPAKVVVYGGKECYAPTSISKPKWHIRCGPLTDVLSEKKYYGFVKTNKYDNAIWALNIYKRMFTTRAGTGTSDPTNIVGQLFKALVAIKSHPKYEDFFKDNLSIFEEWLTGRAYRDTSPSEDWLFQEHTHNRMECRHLGTALGIVKKFRGAVVNGGTLKPVGQSTFTIGPMKDSFENWDKKKAEQEEKRKQEKKKLALRKVA